MIEIAIKISDENQTLRIKHVLYNAELMVSQDDKTLKNLVDAAVRDFKGSATDLDVLVTIKFHW